VRGEVGIEKLIEQLNAKMQSRIEIEAHLLLLTTIFSVTEMKYALISF